MPELPEVETVKNHLNNIFENNNNIVKNIDINYQKIIKSEINEFQNKLIGETLVKVNRYGKYLFFEFKKYSIISHLRMEGKYFYYPNSTSYTKNKHDHIIFEFNNDSLLVYNDVRKFGTMKLVLKKDEYADESIKKLGVEATDKKNLTYKYLKNKSKKNTKIKIFLLDQTVIAGLGNIYVDEILFRSKINPQRLINEINKKDYERIIDNTIHIMDEAILNKGSTIKSFKIDKNSEGEFQNKLLVYKKENTPCVNCNTLIKKIKINGRGTRYCPSCQSK